jgi:ATP-grasp domain, R2K clade family 3
MSRHVLYYRHGYEEMLQQEMSTLNKHFYVTDDLEQIEPGDLVLCRFSLLPFAQALEQEIRSKGATLVHDLAAHEFIADMRNWYPLLSHVTPATFFSEDVQGDGPFFVKGITNSIKSSWQDCYAQDKADLQRVLNIQNSHPLLGSQPKAIRQYEPLMQYGICPDTGIPITCEFRCFMFEDHLLSSGFYWNSRMDIITKACQQQGLSLPNAKDIPTALLQRVAKAVRGHARYFVVDVARKADGQWTVIELNDATMSGLSANNPETLYRNLRAAL